MIWFVPCSEGNNTLQCRVKRKVNLPKLSFIVNSSALTCIDRVWLLWTNSIFYNLTLSVTSLILLLNKVIISAGQKYVFALVQPVCSLMFFISGNYIACHYGWAVKCLQFNCKYGHFWLRCLKDLLDKYIFFCWWPSRAYPVSSPNKEFTPTNGHNIEPEG